MSKDKSSAPGSLPVSAGTFVDEGSDGGADSDSRFTFWEKHLDDWHQSGLSQSEYCRSHDLNYHLFCRWKSKFKQYYRPKASIKLVEVKRDFTLNMESSSGDFAQGASGGPGKSSFGSAGYGLGDRCFSPGGGVGRKRYPSGIGFWYGEFYIEVDVRFSSESLSQLLGTLQSFGSVKSCGSSRVTEEGSG